MDLNPDSNTILRTLHPLSGRSDQKCFFVHDLMLTTTPKCKGTVTGNEYGICVLHQCEFAHFIWVTCKTVFGTEEEGEDHPPQRNFIQIKIVKH